MRKSRRNFLTDEDGAITIEVMLALPMVVFAFTAVFVFFDAFRVNTASQKAAYIVADGVSRQTDPIDEDFVLGMNQLHDILARTRNPTTMRVSSIGWDDDEQRFLAIWSVNTGTGPVLSNAEVNGPLSDRLPSIPEGDTMILVETFVNYTPLYNVGISPQVFRQAIVTRPRFAPQVAFDTGNLILFQNFGPPTCDDGGELCS
ncbi:MAG: pilus assembly protein [Rubellimicrobium sp.]|nr:pilus assembly protein [Rubellimicrobium sp.]